MLKLNIFTIPWQQLIYSTAYIHARKNVKRKPTQPHASLTYSPFQSCFHSHCDFTFFSLVCLFQHYALDNCKSVTNTIRVQYCIVPGTACCILFVYMMVFQWIDIYICLYSIPYHSIYLHVYTFYVSLFRFSASVNPHIHHF